jgi:hypothetical protein
MNPLMSTQHVTLAKQRPHTVHRNNVSKAIYQSPTAKSDKFFSRASDTALSGAAVASLLLEFSSL